MADGTDVLAAFLAVVAVLGVGWLTLRAVVRSPRMEPLRTRVAVTPVTKGPVQALLQAGGGPFSLAARLEGSARHTLSEWMAAKRGVPPVEAKEAALAGRVRLDPVLVHLMEERTFDAWWRDEAYARWKGPRGLFLVWYKLVELTGSRESRCVRYLDHMTKKLEETVLSE